MAWNNTPSDWQTTTKPEQYKDGATGLTAKQTDMAGSMYPGAFKPSEPEAKPQDDGISSDTLQQEKAEEYKQAPDKMAQKKAEMQASGIQQKVQDVSSRIGAFSYSLQEKVNKFLTAPTDTFGIMATLDPKTGEIVSTDTKTNLDPAIAQKQAQQKAITDSMQQYLEKMNTGGYRAKSFMEAMKGQLGNDDQSAQLMQMIDTLDNMKKSGYGDSTEAKALQQQMEEMDTFGLASQLRGAKGRYENLMGIGAAADATKWYGETGKEGKTALELSQLSADSLKDEMQKASVSASGLFSGEVESSLVQEYDRQSVEAKRSGQLDKQTNDAFALAADAMLDDTTTTMGKTYATIKEKLNSPELQKDIQAILDGLGVEGADLWGDMLADGGTLYDVITKTLNDPDSGLANEERKLLSNYMGSLGGGTGEGQLALWIKSLANSGEFTITEEDGTPRVIKPSAQMKHEILRLMTDPNINRDQAMAKVGEMIGGLQTGSTLKDGSKQTINTFLKSILDGSALQAGKFDTTLTNFKDGLTKTLKSFVGSKTEEAFKNSMAKILGPTVVGIDKMSVTELSKYFHEQLTPSEQEAIRKLVKVDIDNNMLQGNKVLEANIKEATNNATKVLTDKLGEVDTEEKRLNLLKDATINYIPNKFNNLKNNLNTKLGTNDPNLYRSKALTDAATGIANQISGQDWFIANVNMNTLTPGDAQTIGMAYALQQYTPLLTELMGTEFQPPDLSKAFNTGAGRVELKDVNAYAEYVKNAILRVRMNDPKIFSKDPKDPTKVSGTFVQNITPQEIDSNNSSQQQIEKALGGLLKTRATLKNALQTVNTQLAQINKEPIQMNPEELMENLLGVSSGKETTEAAGKDTGMQIINGNLVFGDGTRVPLTPEVIAQIQEAMALSAGTGFPASISTGDTRTALGQSNLPSGMGLPTAPTASNELTEEDLAAASAASNPGPTWDEFSKKWIPSEIKAVGHGAQHIGQGVLDTYDDILVNPAKKMASSAGKSLKKLFGR